MRVKRRRANGGDRVFGALLISVADVDLAALDLVITDARIIVGDGRVIDRGSVVADTLPMALST